MIAKLALVVLTVQLISKVIDLIFHSCSYPRFDKLDTAYTLVDIQGPPLVWVLWVLQHPQFLKVWVLAPTVFGKFLAFASIFIEMIRKMSRI